MKYSFTDKSVDIKTLQKFGDINSFLLENNTKQIEEIYNFLKNDRKLLLINGYMGTGKTAITEYCLNFLNPDCITLKYNCFETTILDDILLSFFEDFKKLAILGAIKPPKSKSENFTQKINAHFESVKKPILVIINSYEEILKNNKPEILGFIKHICSMDNVKVIIISRIFKNDEFEEQKDKVTILALDKAVFEKYLRSEDIKQIGPLSDELYKHTRGYFFYTNLSIKIMRLKQIQLIDFLDSFSKSLVTFNDFILREALSLVDPVSGHLFRFLTIIRHPVSIKLLKTLHLYDEQKVKFFTDNLLISKLGENIYLQDYYKIIAENSISENVSVKIHQGCVDLYNTQLPLKPFERNLLISRQTMRNEIEYHSMFIPQQKYITKNPETQVEQNNNDDVFENSDIQTIQEEKNTNIEKMTFVFEEDGSGVLDSIADSIKNYMSSSDKYRQEDKEDNKLSLNELINKAKQEENSFNYKHAIRLYSKALLMKNDEDYYTYLPTIYTKLAFGFQNISNWYDAQKYFELAKEFYKSTGDIQRICEIEYNIANVMYMTFKKDRAKSVLTEILKCQISQELRIKALNMLADIATDTKVSERYYREALEINPQGVDKTVLAELYYKYALTCEENNDMDSAIKYYKKCLEIKDNPYISRTLSNIAQLYDDIGESTAALKYFKESLKIDEQTKNLNGIYSISMKLAEIYCAKSPNLALEYYEKALQIAQQLNETFYIIASLTALGDYYYDRKNDKKAYENYKQAYDLTKENKYEDNANKLLIRIDNLKKRNSEERPKQVEK